MAHGFDLNPTRQRGTTVRETLIARHDAGIARIARMVEIGHYPVDYAREQVAEQIVSHTRWLNLCRAQGTLDAVA